MTLKMDNILLVLIFVSTACVVKAQQEVMFTQYMHNEVTINPAYAGSHDVVSATALYRHQWAGIEGAPKTLSFNGHTPLRNEKIGVGLSLIRDQIGVTDNTHFYASGSYRIKISETMKLQLGLQAGGTSTSADLTSLQIDDPDDPYFNKNTGATSSPNFGGGIHLENDKFYFGFSVPQLLTNKLEVAGEKLLEQTRHYFLTTGYVFDINDRWKAKPSLFVKASAAAPIEVDITANAILDDRYWFGLAYRTGDAASLLLMYQATEQFRVGYAYDFPIKSDIREQSSGSHEIVLNYRFAFSKNKVLTPRYF